MSKRFSFWGNSAPAYTPAERRGELGELKTLLRDPHVEKDNLRRREVFKKIIAFMTLGVDTSSLFTEVIIACATKDLVQKKMIYLYLCTNSEVNSEIAILAISTLQKDCKDETPVVRGLALRSLASLRLPQITEYLVPTLKMCLSDSSPYVRKTAIIACLRLFRASPETFTQMGLGDKLYGMLRDNDPQVCSNALAVLQEVNLETGGVKVTKSILYFLLNRLRDMNEWQQCSVIPLVTKYTPANENEVFDIMNLLEERLRGSNSGVILEVTKVFLYLTQNLPTVHAQVFVRLKEPLLTLMTTSQSTETTYAVLCHIKLLALRDPKPFQSSYKDFYCRHTDPSFIKCIKIELLAAIANDRNCGDIIEELVAYVSDMTRAVSKLAINAVGRIALKVDSSSKTALKHFLDLLEMEVEYIRGETLVVMKDFLRKYTDIDTVRPFLDRIVKSYNDTSFEDDESKVALVWTLGEFGEHVEDAPYILEGMIGSFPTESPAFRMEMMTALMKLFFKRPPEVQPVLGAVFAQAINDFSHADVHDRALLYYRLLRFNPKAAAQVVATQKAPVSHFLEDDNADTRDKLFEEFNTASVIYNTPECNLPKFGAADDDEEDDEADEEEEDEEEDEGLLSSKLELDDEADEIDKPTFQKHWGTASATTVNMNLKFKAVPPPAVLQDTLEEAAIFTLACGQQGTVFKMFLYAGSTDGAFFVAEMQAQVNGQTLIICKSEDARVNDFAACVQKALAGFCA